VYRFGIDIKCAKKKGGRTRELYASMSPEDNKY
jgi:hypothetical protein